MTLFDNYSRIIADSLLKISPGDALSINTEEKDFELAKRIAAYCVEITKTTVKIVLTNQGKPVDVVDFDPSEPSITPKTMCMLHLYHIESQNTDTDLNKLDIIIDKNDLRAVQKLNHLADPIILDRRIAIPWCTVPAYEINNPDFRILLDKLSFNLDEQILSAKYRTESLNKSDIKTLHCFSDNCDFSIDLLDNSKFVGGPERLSNGRDFSSSINYSEIMINVDKYSIDGWFDASLTVFGKKYCAKFIFHDGTLVNISNCNKINELFSFDEDISKPGIIFLDDKSFSIQFGGACAESLSFMPESETDLPLGFNKSLYKCYARLDERINVEYKDSFNKKHILVSDGFFLESY